MVYQHLIEVIHLSRRDARTEASRLMNRKHMLRIMKKQLYTKNHNYPGPSKTSLEARQHRPAAEQEPPFQEQH